MSRCAAAAHAPARRIRCGLTPLTLHASTKYHINWAHPFCLPATAPQARKQNPKAFVFAARGRAKLARTHTAEKSQKRMHGEAPLPLVLAGCCLAAHTTHCRGQEGRRSASTSKSLLSSSELIHPTLRPALL